MSYLYEYAFKKITNKESIDLSKFKNEITETLVQIFQNKIESIEVKEKYFKFILNEKAVDADRRLIGKNIVARCEELNKVKEVYAYGTQLFIGREYEISNMNEEKIKSLEVKDITFDSCSQCFSVLSTINVGDYNNLISDTYIEKGGIEGQREKLKTTTAIRIFNRMIDDVKKGAILPSIVIGVLVPKDSFEKLNKYTIGNDYNSVKKLINSVDKNNLSIIDGMQRTSILLENIRTIEENKIRVEFWIASDHNSLTYRMLVLNTGQIPWSLRRQIEVVFAPIIKSLTNTIDEEFEHVEIFKIDDKRKRVESGQYQSDKILEMYLAFNLRKESTDLPEQLATEFSKLDMLESVSKENTFEYFVELFKIFIKLDMEFGKHRNLSIIHSEGKFIDGKDLFSSQPACIGFFAAVSRKIFGRLGKNKDIQHQDRSVRFVINRCEKIIEKLKDNSENVKDFVSFDILMEEFPNVKSSIGEKERKYFREAFEIMLEDDFELDSLQECWRR